MQIFISSSNLSFDKNSNLNFLDIDNIDSVTQDDIIIGGGTFRDELIIKSLINKGCLPFFVTLERDNQISSMFKNLTLVVSVDSYLVSREIVKEIVDIRKIIYELEDYIREFDEQERLEESLKELLVNNQYLLNSFSLRSGQKSVGVEATDKSLSKLYIYVREGKKNKTIYVILQEGSLFKVFSQEVDVNFEIKEKLIKNNFNKKIKSLMESHIEEYIFRNNKFKNITLGYKQEFLLIDKEQNKLLDIRLLDFVLKIYSDIDIESIAVYSLYYRQKEIDEKGKNLLFSIHNHLKDKENGINDIMPFLKGRNLGEGFRNKEKRANMVSDVFIKFIEKINSQKAKKRITNFDFAIITLREEFDSLDEHILTNIFYHIADGIGISSIIKKEFSNFIHSFESYQNIVEESEEALEFDECYSGLEDFVDEYQLNQRVLNIEHIDRLRRCLGESSELLKGLNRLYSQLSYQEIGSYDIEQLKDSDSFEDDMVKKNYYEDFVTIMLNSLFNMRGFDGIKLKGLALFLSYVAYRLSIDEKDKSIDCCFFIFLNLYADKEPENLLLRLKKYFEYRELSVMEFFQERELYSCSGDNQTVTLLTPKYRDKSAKCEKFRNQKIRKFEPDLLKVGEFYRIISNQKKMDIAIQSLIDKIVDGELKSDVYCQNKVTLEFLKIFFSGEKECDERLSHFFDCFGKELGINPTQF